MAATLLTAGNLIGGLTAILLVAAGGLFGWSEPPLSAAVWCIVAAGILDALDGPVARRLGGARAPWGREFDALADLVSFGVAPVVLIGTAMPVSLRALTLPACAAFVIAGAWRLARFLWTSTDRPAGRFDGLPITGAGLALAALWLFEEGLWGGLRHHWVIYALMGTTALLMVSRLPYERFPVFMRGHRRRWMLACGIGAVIAIQPSVLGLVAALLYAAHGPLHALLAGPVAVGVSGHDDLQDS